MAVQDRHHCYVIVQRHLDALWQADLLHLLIQVPHSLHLVSLPFPSRCFCPCGQSHHHIHGIAYRKGKQSVEGSQLPF